MKSSIKESIAIGATSSVSELTEEQKRNFEAREKCLDQMDKIRETQLSIPVKSKSSFFKKLFRKK